MDISNEQLGELINSSVIPKEYKIPLAEAIVKQWDKRREKRPVDLLIRLAGGKCSKTEMGKIFTDLATKIAVLTTEELLDDPDIGVVPVTNSILKSAAMLLTEGPDVTLYENLIVKNGKVIGYKKDGDDLRFSECKGALDDSEKPSEATYESGLKSWYEPDTRQLPPQPPMSLTARMKEAVTRNAVQAATQLGRKTLKIKTPAEKPGALSFLELGGKKRKTRRRKTSRRKLHRNVH